MENYINTAASDIARARTVGLNQLAPEPFPVLVIGSKSVQSFFFANRGTLESWSGNVDYRIRLTIGDVTSRPINGTFEIDVDGGATLTLPYDLDAAGLQNALNDDPTISGEGGVYVFDRGFGRYLIAYKELGAVTALSVSGELLVPDISANLTVLTTGTSMARQLMILSLPRPVALQTQVFAAVSSPYGGWSGTVDLTGSVALQILWLKGERIGEYLQLQTLLTLEVIDADGIPTPVYQTQITLRGLNHFTTSTMLTTGPTRHDQASSVAGTVTITPTSQIHTELVTFTGTGTRNVVIGTTGLTDGAHVDLVFDLSGLNDGVVVNVYQNNTGDTKKIQFTKASGDTNCYFALRSDGNSNFDNVEQVVPAYTDA